MAWVTFPRPTVGLDVKGRSILASAQRTLQIREGRYERSLREDSETMSIRLQALVALAWSWCQDFKMILHLQLLITNTLYMMHGSTTGSSTIL